MAQKGIAEKEVRKQMHTTSANLFATEIEIRQQESDRKYLKEQKRKEREARKKAAEEAGEDADLEQGKDGGEEDPKKEPCVVENADGTSTAASTPAIPTTKPGFKNNNSSATTIPPSDIGDIDLETVSEELSEANSQTSKVGKEFIPPKPISPLLRKIIPLCLLGMLFVFWYFLMPH